MKVQVPVNGTPRCPNCNKRIVSNFNGYFEYLCKCKTFTVFYTRPEYISHKLVSLDIIK